MIVIIDLYFPQLRPAYDAFKKLPSETNVSGGEFNLYDPKYREKYRRFAMKLGTSKKQSSSCHDLTA